jgi:sugar lactone lactonase YvrE
MRLTLQCSALVVLGFTAVALPLATAGAGAADSDKPRNPIASVSVFAIGLENPRGLKFGPDGHLYVAEGGTGGVNPVVECADVPGAGPYLGSEHGGRISRIDASGNRTTITDTLPSSQTAPIPSPLISGVADIAFIKGTMYALLAGAGCTHGVRNTPNGIVRVHANGSWELIANLSAYQQANPVKNPNPGDFEPDGTWWGMVAVHGDLYAVEPNHGEMVKVTTSGKIRRVIDISASQGHIVPTAIADHGVFYVSNLGTFDPDQLNKQKIFQITPSGQFRVVARGLSKVLGLAFDAHGRLYALETSYSKTDVGPVPFTGRLLRIFRNGEKQLIDTGGSLFFPTGMTFGPDGALYVSNMGFGPPFGEILRIELPHTDDDD